MPDLNLVVGSAEPIEIEVESSGGDDPSFDDVSSVRLTIRSDPSSTPILNLSGTNEGNVLTFSPSQTDVDSFSKGTYLGEVALGLTDGTFRHTKTFIVNISGAVAEHA